VVLTLKQAVNAASRAKTRDDDKDIDVLQARLEARQINLQRKDRPMSLERKKTKRDFAWTAKNKAKGGESSSQTEDHAGRDNDQGDHSGAAKGQPAVWPRKVRFDI
jgi:hypothetical protein